jgi:putative two-component system response regulator
MSDFPTAAAMAEARATVLVVDDTPENLQLMHGLLREHYRVRLATSGEIALRLAATEPRPDLILLDIMMPGLNGFEVCRRLKAEPQTRAIPVIFLTAMDQDIDQEEGFSCGCVDYITKPIAPPLVMARVATHIALKHTRDQLAETNANLQREVERQTHEVHKVQEVTIMAMASLAETRDNETGMHLRRTQEYVRALAEDLQQDSPYADELDTRSIDLMTKSAPLHDIGKVGIPDGILLKPGRLTSDEFDVMKTHAEIGARIIASAEEWLGTPSSFLRFAREIAHHHHENWDGSGYPDGLAGTAIPLSARLMALADVYDALICRRIYKKAFSHADAIHLIINGSAGKFDPVLLLAFERLAPRFAEIAEDLRDRPVSNLNELLNPR